MSRLTNFKASWSRKGCWSYGKTPRLEIAGFSERAGERRKPSIKIMKQEDTFAPPDCCPPSAPVAPAGLEERSGAFPAERERGRGTAPLKQRSSGRCAFSREQSLSPAGNDKLCNSPASGASPKEKTL